MKFRCYIPEPWWAQRKHVSRLVKSIGIATQPRHLTQCVPVRVQYCASRYVAWKYIFIYPGQLANYVSDVKFCKIIIY